MGALDANLPAETPSPVVPAPQAPVRRRWFLPTLCVLALTVLLAAHPLLTWRTHERTVNLSLSNLRELGKGTALYAQDWDGRPMPLAVQNADRSWRVWSDFLLPYIAKPSQLEHPGNPIDRAGMRHPQGLYPIRSGYALNRRFWNTFGKGAFPFDNLDLPAQTALFVEAGPMWRNPLQRPTPTEPAAPFALMEYGDIRDRVQGYSPYPSAHRGKMAVAAADGHAAFIRVERYEADAIPHDPLYGLIGGGIYNWNGGYPPNALDRPPHE